MVTFLCIGNDIRFYGPRIISSYLKVNNIETQIIFIYGDPGDKYPKVSDSILKDLTVICKSSNLICVSLTSAFLSLAKLITFHIKTEINAPIMWGGIHPTFEPEQSLNFCDIVCIGEGENPTLHLVQSINSGKINYNIKSLWFNSHTGIIKNALMEIEQDLDKFPHPDYDFEDHYIFWPNLSLFSANHVIKFKKEMFLSLAQKLKGKIPWYSTTTSRGCPHDCSFCCNSALKKLYKGNGRFIRKRDILNVIDEIENMTERFNYAAVCLSDENLFIRTNDEIDLFLSLYLEKINLPLHIEFSPQLFDEKKAAKFINAGCEVFQIGVQSYNEYTNRNIYFRNQTKKQIDKILLFINNYKNLRVYLHFIILNPWENSESITETSKFIAGLKKGITPVIYPLTFYPGTQFYERAINEGLITCTDESIEDWDFKRYYKVVNFEVIILISFVLMRELFGVSFTKISAKLFLNRHMLKILQVPLFKFIVRLFYSYFLCRFFYLRFIKNKSFEY